MYEGMVQTKSKLTTMFHLDSTADDAWCHIQCMNFSINWKSQFFLPRHLEPSIGVTRFEFMEKLYGSWN